MLKVAIITNSLTGGGAERSMNILGNELGTRDLVTILIAINEGPDDAVELEIPVIKIRKIWRGSFRNTVESYLRFKSALRDTRPDIVIANCDLPEFFVALTPGKFRIIVTEHVSRPWYSRKLLGIITRNVLNLRGAHWVAVSDHLKIWPWNFEPEKILRNGVLLPPPMEIAPKQELKRLIFIGRLTEQKNPEMFVELSNMLRLPAIVIGDGPLMAQLKTQSVTNGSAITFLGMQFDPWKYIKTGDLLVVPSNWEGDGLVVVEALAVGVPILLTNISEFKKFNLEELNYCESLSNFQFTIDKYRNDINKLIPSAETRKNALAQRNIQQISQEWHEFFKLIEQ